MKLHLADMQSAIEWGRARMGNETAGLNDLQSRVEQMQVPGSAPFEDSLLLGSARDLWLEWYASTPDTPCIAICSTSQGDDVCKGCGRTFEEVIHWLSYSPFEKRNVWHRITDDGIAWRFNHYKERAR